MKRSFQVVYRSFYECYMDVGFMIKMSVLWFLCILPIVTIGPAISALCYVLRLHKEGASPTYADFWVGFKRYGKTGFILSLIYGVITVPALFYMAFFLAQELIFAKVMGLVMGYGILMWHMLYLYLFGLMIAQHVTSPMLLFKRSFKLVSEQLVFSLHLCVYLVFITCLSILLPILLLVWAAWVLLILYNALLSLLEKYHPNEYSFQAEVNWKGAWQAWKE